MEITTPAASSSVYLKQDDRFRIATGITNLDLDLGYRLWLIRHNCLGLYHLGHGYVNNNS